MHWLFSRVVVAMAAFAMAFTAAHGTSTAGQTSGVPERFTALAVNAFGPAQSGTVEMVVTRWSTRDEHDMLIGALLDRGPDAFLDELREMPLVGYIRSPGSIGYDLHLADGTPLEDGGRRIVLITDRPLSFWEAAGQARSIDYPFTTIELRLNRDGEGEGTMRTAAKITGNKEFNLIEIEDYAVDRVRLMAVRSSRLPTS